MTRSIRKIQEQIEGEKAQLSLVGVAPIPKYPEIKIWAGNIEKLANKIVAAFEEPDLIKLEGLAQDLRHLAIRIDCHEQHSSYETLLFDRNLAHCSFQLHYACEQLMLAREKILKGSEKNFYLEQTRAHMTKAAIKTFTAIQFCKGN